jgi:hypothetical protein
LSASTGLDPSSWRRGDEAATPTGQPLARASAAAGLDASYASGSRRLDLLACLLLACLVVGSSHWRLRVYHQITVWEVSLTRVAPDEERQSLAVPEHIRRSFAATLDPAGALASLERDIRQYMASGQAARQAAAGDRFEWRVRYGHNSVELDQQRLLVFAADGTERR